MYIPIYFCSLNYMKELPIELYHNYGGRGHAINCEGDNALGHVLRVTWGRRRAGGAAGDNVHCKEDAVPGLVGATTDVHCYDLLLNISGASNVLFILYLHFWLSVLVVFPSL